MPRFSTLVGHQLVPIEVNYTVDEDGDAVIKSVTGIEGVDVLRYIGEDDIDDLIEECDKHYPAWAKEERDDAAISRYESEQDTAGAYL